MNVSEKLLGFVQTNNRAEMTAVLYVLKMIPKWVTLQICTDSQLVVDTLLYWMEGWKRKGWKTSTGQDVKNKDDFLELDRIINEARKVGVDIKWNHVKGHANIEGNEQADRLAVLGAQMKN